jgi:hypothetical protein
LPVSSAFKDRQTVSAIETGERRVSAAGHAFHAVDHEDEHAELAFHHLGEACRWDIAQTEFGGEAFARSSRILEAVTRGDPESSPQQWNGAADLRRECSVRRDPAAGHPARMHRGAARRQPDCRHEKRPSPASRNGSVK